MTTLTVIGIWFLAIALILGFFAGARRISAASRTKAIRSSRERKTQAVSLTPPTRETA